jgi:cyclophilin family peptidyl-prolyl cis-trans isomerase
MKIMQGVVVLTLVALVFGSSACGTRPEVDDEVAVLETTYGRVVIEFLPRAAPKHVDNFKSIAREGLYDGTRFHRIVKDKKSAVIAVQGGDPNTINGNPATWGQGAPGQKTVPAEFSALKHERGVVSAARKADDVNSASSQFFICTSAQSGFDGQYSIFGRVIEGMNVVDSIARAPAAGEKPIDPVTLNRTYIIKRTELK